MKIDNGIIKRINYKIKIMDVTRSNRMYLFIYVCVRMFYFFILFCNVWMNDASTYLFIHILKKTKRQI